MLEKLRTPFKRLIAPVAKALVALGLSANAVTVIGAFDTIIVVIVTAVTGWLVPGSLLIAVLAAFDALDGSVAALTTGGTKFGAFLDSTLDRVVDWAVLLAVALYFPLHGGMSIASGGMNSANLIGWVGIGATLYAMMTSFVTSYTRARAESVGYEAKNGIATRSDRLVIIIVGMLVTGLTGMPIVLAGFIVVLAVLGTVTVFQRIFEVRRQMKDDNQN
ncbi:CDP-diacylglycerol--glycerol-3-phosphate 3-phosphatidyltransferase [Bifidobacterium bohemicum]|uniref:Phosphatidylinositol phosphate synthase n=1 Tax=Bifidobacterium bohemicum DSM 22767 TaxID=1437606 RepID=A0A086ZJ55_9BIFI|nr:CDP-alcohol phosphatidyltransferase family protein [Bifidobacterium bohemicum]KFI46555.1 CDP-alcohol phosphatidyltransferase [Bifidobacterium bohemicum DSM 22767]SCB74996.1 CDP-diacylglycerol--glycerol-3-phosphate 3-phosphatidyltransferase [Bifidobacterium bohemicum]